MQYHNFVEFLTYDQVSLVPVHVSSLRHRSEADTSVLFGPIKLGVPIIAAPMPDVSNGPMALALARLGSFGWAHRFQTVESQLKNLELYEGQSLNTIGAALPLYTIEKIFEIFYGYGQRIFCIDTANGANEMVHEAVVRLKDKYPDIFIVSGNVATPEAFSALQEWGVDAIRVGIAGGSVCETRTETGIYSPMATTVYACNLAKRKSLLIADGGIKSPGDVVKAIVLGADVVMLGGMLAGTSESPGSVIKIDGKKYKMLRGAASFSVQKESKGVDPDYIEGSETLVEYRGSVEKVINRIQRGLQSAMSYADARTLEELRSNMKVIKIG